MPGRKWGPDEDEMARLNRRALARFITSPRRWLGLPRYVANRRRFRQYWEREKQAHPETVTFLHSIQERFHAGGGFAWELQDFKLFCWDRLLRSELPPVCCGIRLGKQHGDFPSLRPGDGGTPPSL